MVSRYDLSRDIILFHSLENISGGTPLRQIGKAKISNATSRRGCTSVSSPHGPPPGYCEGPGTGEAGAAVSEGDVASSCAGRGADDDFAGRDVACGFAADAPGSGCPEAGAAVSEGVVTSSCARRGADGVVAGRCFVLDFTADATGRGRSAVALGLVRVAGAAGASGLAAFVGVGGAWGVAAGGDGVGSDFTILSISRAS